MVELSVDTQTHISLLVDNIFTNLCDDCLWAYLCI